MDNKQAVDWDARNEAAERIQKAFDHAQLHKRTKEEERNYVRDAFVGLNS